MSSMFEGGHDWAREDELDLGQEADEGQQLHGSNAAQDITNGKLPGDRDNGSMAHVGEDLSPVLNGHEPVSTAPAGIEGDAPPLDLPSSPQQEELRGSLDETASTPDDTPSLQVVASFFFSFDPMLTVTGLCPLVPQ